VIVVDTSVLVPIFRSAPAAETTSLWQLIDADLVTIPNIARLEIRAVLAPHQRGQMARLLRALPACVPTEETWQRVEAWTDKAAIAGERFGLADLLIGAMADELGALVWSLDKDFERMAKLKFVRLYA